MNLKLTIIITGLIICFTPPLLADSDYTRGLNAFKQGDYTSALDAFSLALQNKPNDSKIHYNLGSSYYKLKQYQKAQKHFLEATHHPSLAPISHYNLGLIFARLKNLEKSKQHFQLASTASDPQIKKLADKQLNKFNKTQTKTKKLSSGRFSGHMNLRYNYDDNITNANDDLPIETSTSDTFYDLFGGISYKLPLNKTTSNIFKFGGYISRYDDAVDYDKTLLNIGLYHARLFHGIRSRVGVHGYRDKIGDIDYQQRITYQVRGDVLYSKAHKFRLQYDYTDINELDDAYIDFSGSRHRIKFENQSKLPNKLRINLGYKYETNDRNDHRTPTSFTSYSPDRHSIYTKIKFSPATRWKVRMNFEYRKSNYDGSIVSSVQQNDREDSRLRAKLSLAYRINKYTDLETIYRYTDNDSNFTSKSYTSNRFSLALNLRYF